MFCLAGFVDVETPTLFKRTPGVSRTVSPTPQNYGGTRFLWISSEIQNKLDLCVSQRVPSQKGLKRAFVSGCQRVCGSIQRAGQVLLSTSESTTVQTASDGGWHRQVGNLLSTTRELSSRTRIFSYLVPSPEPSRTVKQHFVVMDVSVLKVLIIHVVLWSNV